MEHIIETILIVEDNDALREMLERSLNAEGYWVMTASHGAAALRILNKETPALILLDVVLPWVSGLEVLSTIRGIARLRDVPVLIVSGTPVMMGDVQPYHPVAILHKPVEVDLLIDTIRKLLRTAEQGQKRLSNE